MFLNKKQKAYFPYYQYCNFFKPGVMTSLPQAMTWRADIFINLQQLWILRITRFTFQSAYFSAYLYLFY